MEHYLFPKTSSLCHFIGPNALKFERECCGGSGVRTGGQRCTSKGLQGQWSVDRRTVVHQHGPGGTVVCGQGDSGAPAWSSREVVCG